MVEFSFKISFPSKFLSLNDRGEKKLSLVFTNLHMEFWSGWACNVRLGGVPNLGLWPLPTLGEVGMGGTRTDSFGVFFWMKEKKKRAEHAIKPWAILYSTRCIKLVRKINILLPLQPPSFQSAYSETSQLSQKLKKKVMATLLHKQWYWETSRLTENVI